MADSTPTHYLPVLSLDDNNQETHAVGLLIV